MILAEMYQLRWCNMLIMHGIVTSVCSAKPLFSGSNPLAAPNKKQGVSHSRLAPLSFSGTIVVPRFQCTPLQACRPGSRAASSAVLSWFLSTSPLYIKLFLLYNCTLSDLDAAKPLLRLSPGRDGISAPGPAASCACRKITLGIVMLKGGFS